MRNGNKINRAWSMVALIALVASAAGITAVWAGSDPAPLPYRSPFDAVFSPDGKLLAVSDSTANAVAIIDPASGKVLRQAAVADRPAGLAWSADGSRLFAAQSAGNTVAEISPADGKVLRQLPAGIRPTGVALAARRGLLLAANSATGDVSAVDLSTGKEKARIKMLREPFWISVTPDESMAVVSNLLPDGSAADPLVTASVSLVDLGTLKRVADIKLPPNTTCIRQTAVSADGKWAYAVHTVGRTTLPATQLERGWVNTNALSIIDLKAKQLYASVLLDNLSEGGADPWGIALSKDNSTMWVSLAGIHQVARIDLAGLHQGLAGQLPPALAPAPNKITPPPGVWADLKSDPAKRAELVNDLTALYVGGLINRVNLPGKAPRGTALAADGKSLAVAMHYSGEVLFVDAASVKVLSTLAMGPQRPIDDVRRGEIIFHDATYSFQHWLSCATCHPNQARADGLNWDLPNDGIGNPKSAKSLLQAHLTAPAMWTGIREGMEAAAMAGFRFSAYQPEAQEVKQVQAYLRSLQPERSPFRNPDGSLSAKAQRGKLIFESAQTHCARCHAGEQFTDRTRYNVGTQGELDHKDQTSFDTPSLVELWRTAPYLHDGRAATIQEIFTRSNLKDQHGKTSQLTKEELDDLAEYLLSL